MSIIGLDALMAQLENIENINQAEALLVGGQVILDEMKTLTPVDTGALLESEGMEVVNNELFIYAGEDYASYVEFGTYKMAAQPFMRPAIDTKSNEAVAAMGVNIENQIKAKVK